MINTAPPTHAASTTKLNRRRRDTTLLAEIEHGRSSRTNSRTETPTSTATREFQHQRATVHKALRARSPRRDPGPRTLLHAHRKTRLSPPQVTDRTRDIRDRSPTSSRTARPSKQLFWHVTSRTSRRAPYRAVCV